MMRYIFFSAIIIFVGFLKEVISNSGITEYARAACAFPAERTAQETQVPKGKLVNTTQSYTIANILNNERKFNRNLSKPGIVSASGTNTNHSIIVKGANLSASISNIINDYTPVFAYDKCKNGLTVEDGSKFNAGDTVLIIQMKGAVIDSSNSSAFGSITNLKNAGNHEFNIIQRKTGSSIYLKNSLLKAYDFSNGVVQLIRVPHYDNAMVTGTLSCLPWDGSKGGVLVFTVKNSIDLQGNIDVSGKGFRGGIISNNPDGDCGTGSPDYYYPLTQPGFSWSSGGAEKGEGIATISDDKRAGKGPLANGGGGGNKHNTGGGGGSNYATGGKGGNELEGCSGGNGGIQGVSLAGAINLGRIFLGGGGGRGDDNNHVGTEGANGGGIIIIKATGIKANNNRIIANGNSQLIPGTGIADGAGGGGAGGAVLMEINSYLDNLKVEANGGQGGDQAATFGCVGTGGGGGGGHIALSSATQPANLTITTIGGQAGIFTSPGYSCTNSNYGAVNGNPGTTLFNLILPFSSTNFLPNIDSVSINDSVTTCGGLQVDFKGFTHVNTFPVNNWQWFFGDGTSATGQNSSHTYAGINSYTVKLVVTDINGCKDSISKPVTFTGGGARIFSRPPDAKLCKGDSVVLNGNNGSVNTNYLWSPGININDNKINNPTVWPLTTQVYSVLITDRLCNVDTTFNVAVTVNTLPDIKIAKTNDIDCSNGSTNLAATGGVSYVWAPASGLSSTTIANPVARPDTTTAYGVIGTDSNGCKNSSSITVIVTKRNNIGAGIAIPNAFTPNNDGRNDCFGLGKSARAFQDIKFSIYNRWGQLIYYSTNPNSCWDGTFKGHLQNPGVFVYKLQAKTLCGNFEKKGTLTLIR